MSKHKTDAQIDSEIAALKALKPTVRQRTAFGDDNHAAIDAQIDVLLKRMNTDEVFNAYADEEEEGGEVYEHVFSAALQASDWMTGILASDEDSPSASWASACL